MTDRSSDYLNRQALVRMLAANGCRYGDVRTTDPRISSELLFLSRGDWKTPDGTVCNFRRRGEGLLVIENGRKTPLEPRFVPVVRFGDLLVSKLAVR